MEEKSEQKSAVSETYRHRVLILLTLIGLWLAMPASCGLLQRIVDNLTSFDIVEKNTGLFIKLSTDICLGIIYIIGLCALVFFGVSGYVLTVGKDKTVETVKANGPKLKKTFREGGAIAGEIYSNIEPPKVKSFRQRVMNIVTHYAPKANK